MTNERKDTISQLLGKWGAGLFRTIILGALGILLWQGKNMVNSAISQNPDVMEAKSSAASATSGLKELSAKVDTIISTEDKIVEGFKISHQDQEKTNN